MAETTARTQRKRPSQAEALERMEELGPQVHDPLHGSSYAFDRDGENLWVYTWFEPGARLPEHFHPSYEEHWEALDGTARAKVAGTWRDLRPEDGPVLVARNVRHALRNESGAPIRARTEVVPAGELVGFLTESARAAREGLYNKYNLPRSWRGATWMADFALRYRDDTVVTSPPPAVQRLLLPLVARFAK
jgi:quercetin dioxygenase-like cupin family protein